MKGVRLAAAAAALSFATLATSAWAEGCALNKIGELPVTTDGPMKLVHVRVNGKEASFSLEMASLESVVTPSARDRLGLTTSSDVTGDPSANTAGPSDYERAAAKDVSFLGTTLHNVQFIVGLPHMAPMADGMLSLNTLTTKDIEFDLADGAVRFFDPKGCTGADFTYWSHGQAASDIRIQPPEAPQKIIVGDAKLNGVAIRVLFNPGMRDSIVNMAAAKRAGISIGAPNVSLVGAMTDEQGNKVDLWLAPIAKFEIGGETIANTYLPIADTPFGGADMVIGGDFFLTHRVYLARSQNRLYFTFNGGQVFGNGEGELASPPPGQVQAMPPPMGASGDTPTDAAGFARRGEARLALRDYDGAITDLTRAVDLEPGDAQHYLDRAMAKIYNRQVASAMTDLEEVLKLKPDNARAHAIRGQLYLIEHDDRNARADFDLVMTLDPTQALNIANIYSTSDRFALAIPIYDQWIADHAKDQADLAEALNGACWARAVANAELDKALGQCDRAVSLNPTDVRIWDTRGLVHLRLGQYDKAIADYDKVLKAQTQQPWSLYGRGLAELKNGLKSQGDADIAAATALAPTLPDKAKGYGLTP